MESLVRKVFTLEKSNKNTCPHGRPISVIKTKKEPVAPKLPCEPGSTMYRIAHRINGEAYVTPVKDISFEIFRNFIHVRDSEGVAYTLGVEIFPSEKEAISAAEKENELKDKSS